MNALRRFFDRLMLRIEAWHIEADISAFDAHFDLLRPEPADLVIYQAAKARLAQIRGQLA